MRPEAASPDLEPLAAMTQSLIEPGEDGPMTEGREEDLSPIGASDWTPERARHLLDRAGFGGPPEEVARLAAMTPEAAVAWFIDFTAVDNSHCRRSSLRASTTRA